MSIASDNAVRALAEKVADIERQLAHVTKGLDDLVDAIVEIKGQYRALNARVGKALKNSD